MECREGGKPAVKRYSDKGTADEGLDDAPTSEAGERETLEHTDWPLADPSSASIASSDTSVRRPLSTPRRPPSCTPFRPLFRRHAARPIDHSIFFFLPVSW